MSNASGGRELANHDDVQLVAQPQNISRFFIELFDGKRCVASTDTQDTDGALGIVHGLGPAIFQPNGLHLLQQVGCFVENMLIPKNRFNGKLAVIDQRVFVGVMIVFIRGYKFVWLVAHNGAI